MDHLGWSCKASGLEGRRNEAGNVGKSRSLEKRADSEQAAIFPGDGVVDSDAIQSGFVRYSL
jgi:hypothetical protein